MKKSFKIQIGYDKYIGISKKDLPNAYYSFINETKMITSDGIAIRGKDIISIEPDWNNILGYNTGYKINEREIENKYIEKAREIMLKAKNVANKTLKENNVKLLN